MDKLWPRGITKEAAHLDEWNKDLAPSYELRKYFDHDPDKFDEFTKRYKKELEDKLEDLNPIKKMSVVKQVRLLYGTKDKEHNNAVVLEEVLKDL